MYFSCPECGRPGCLEIASVLELPADARSDEIQVQTLRCRSCGLLAAGVYEESRRGGLDDESIDHRGFRLEPEAWRRLAGTVASCPRPRDKHCPCPAHRELGLKNEYGRWIGLDPFSPGPGFPLVR